MKIKDLKKLAKLSYNGITLDQKKVLRITKFLKRQDLKNFIKELKRIEKRNTVIAYLPSLKDLTINKKLDKIFPGKKIKMFEDKSLIAGIRVQLNDNIYDFSLRKKIEDIAKYINE